ncbi:MAG: hypothetical protein QF473_09275 [Planctomycetota bacterium]|jgi:hypothetical protein|nr:hypothetical protein [Planctomycetota bacterium]
MARMMFGLAAQQVEETAKKAMKTTRAGIDIVVLLQLLLESDRKAGQIFPIIEIGEGKSLPRKTYGRGLGYLVDSLTDSGLSLASGCPGTSAFRTGKQGSEERQIGLSQSCRHSCIRHADLPASAGRPRPEEKAVLLEIARELYEHRPKDVRCFQLRWSEM